MTSTAFAGGLSSPLGVTAARATDLTKVYGQGETQVVALDAVSVEFRQA
ncbi:ABC transporter ATP-binding protein, partial [Streptomyces cinnamoneus]